MINNIFFTLILELTTLSTPAFQIDDAEKDTLNQLLQAGHGTTVAIKQQHQDDSDPIATDTNTFQQLVKKSNMFLDNTLIIPYLLQHNPLPRMLIAPGKWGKSTTLDMIRSFLQMRVDRSGNIIPRNFTTNYRLFAKGEIAINNGSVIQKLKNPLLISQLPRVVTNNQGLYPVVYLNFTDVMGESYEEIKRKITKEIGRAYKQHRYLLVLLSQNVNNSKSRAFRWRKHREKFHKYLLHDGLRKPEDSLQFLCRMLKNLFNRRVYLLVDDFDAPLVSMLRYENFSKPDFPKTFDHIVDLFATVFLKADLDVAAIMTGKFPLKIDNNIKWIPHNDYSATERSQIQEYFGFKKQQVRFLLRRNHINDSLLQLAHEWYDGFNVQVHYHHPASIARFLKHERVECYHQMHWSEELILEMLQTDSNFRHSISSLIDGEAVSIFPEIFQIDKLGKNLICLDPGFISYSIANNYTLPKDYLKYWYGYLVVEGYLTEISDSRAKIPNKEMTYVMENWIGYANAHIALPGSIYS